MEEKVSAGRIQRVEIARPTGFCFGVRRAVETLEKALRELGVVHGIGSPIHNPQEIERLRQMGLVLVDGPEDVPGGGVAFIRAHGAPRRTVPELEQRGVRVIDGTCPFVETAQDRAGKLSREGYTVVILGDVRHPEVQAIRESVEGPVSVAGPGEMPVIEPGVLRVGVVSQTTQKRKSLERLAARLTGEVEELRVYNTICGATAARQRAVADMAGRLDGIIVIGGKNSANTGKLVEIARAAGAPVLWIEQPSEIDRGWLENRETVGIAAGASTPEWLIHQLQHMLLPTQGVKEDGRENDGCE